MNLSNSLCFLAPAGCGGWPLRRRTGFRGGAESGEHLGSDPEADGDPVHGELQLLHPGECHLLAGEQRGGFRKRGVQTAPGDLSGARPQRLDLCHLPHRLFAGFSQNFL